MGKILHIDDNALNRRLVRDILQIAGHEMLEAGNGYAGVAKATKERPDLILMDVEMPYMNGFEAVGKLKATPELAHIPVVAVTANTDDRERCLAAGYDAYLPKPVTRKELLNLVESLLTRSPQI